MMLQCNVGYYNEILQLYLMKATFLFTFVCVIVVIIQFDLLITTFLIAQHTL